MYRAQRAAVAFAHVAALTAPSLRDVREQETYRDPGGRFSVMVPAGWNATPQEGGVIIANGSVTAVFAPFRGATSARDVVNAVTNQYGSQWRDLQRVDQGEFMLAGRPASYAIFSGINPRGTASMLRLAGVADNREAYAVIMSAPRNEFNAASGALQSIEQSFTLASGIASPDYAPTRSPAQGGGALGIRGTIGLNGQPIEPSVAIPRGSAPPGAMPSVPSAAPNNGAVLGVATRDVEDADLPRIGINERLGAFVIQVVPGGAAERARVMPGDLILSADRKTIRQHVELQGIVQSHRPGESMELIVMRQGKALTLQVPLR